MSATSLNAPAQSSALSGRETLCETITVQRSVEEVYAYLVDFSTIEQWDPGVHRAVKTTPGAPRAGSRFELSLNLPGGHQPMDYELIELDAPSRLVLRGRGPGFSVIDTIRLTALDGARCQIEYRAELRFEGWRALARAPMRPLLKRIGRQAVSGLARALNPEPPVAERVRTRLTERLVLPAALDFTRRGYLRMPNKGLSHRLEGRTVLVTGPSTGLGLATACECARLGARVLLVGRDELRLQRARQAVADFSGQTLDQMPVYVADLSLMSELRQVAARIRKEEPVLDVLINNAGALFAERGETAEGHERALAINLLAPWALSRELMPLLEARGGRIINVASGGLYLQPLRLDDMQYRRGRYDGAKAYARAKRGLVSVSQRLAKAHPSVSVHAMHPGWAATPGVAKSLPAFNRALGERLRDARMGADTIVWLASSPAVAGSTGLFWFDRQPRPVSVLPGTDVSARQSDRLRKWLEENAGD